MKITRRNFIQTLGTAALAIGFLNPVENVFGQTRTKDDLFLIPPESMNDPLAYLTSKHFEPFVNTFVRVQKNEKRIVELELIEVKELNNKDNEKRGFTGESFSLLFQSSGKIKLPQNTYKVEHAALGEFSLFLVPVGLKGNRYQAIINRIGNRF